jgi:hypothetical protein
MGVSSSASRSGRPATLAAILLVAACSGGGGGPGGNGGSTGGYDPAPASRPRATAALAELPKIISNIGIVKARVKADQHQGYLEQQAGYSGPPYDGMTRRYLDIETQINGWIDEYQTAVRLDQDVRATYPSLQNAFMAADAYLQWLKDWHRYNARPQGANGGPTTAGANGGPVQEVVEEFARKLIPVITQAGIDVWNETRKADAEDKEAARQRVIDALETARWPDWGKL